MQLRCPSSFSSPSQAPSSLPLAYNVNPATAPTTACWSGCYRSATRRKVFRYLRNNLLQDAVSARSPKVSFGSGIAREAIGSTSWDFSISAPHPPARTSRVAISRNTGSGLRQGSSIKRRIPSFLCEAKFGSEQDVDRGQGSEVGLDQVGGQLARRVGQAACWVVTVVYIGWLFVLPNAPGDPVWAISPSTIQMLIDLSLNFFFVLPIASSLSSAAGFDGLTAPVLHPTSEALFNIVLGWTLLFAPLLFTDRKRDRFGGSLEILWIIQMFLTNTVLAPYMAIRQNTSPADKDKGSIPLETKLDILSRGMTTGATIVGIVGAIVGLVSLLWFFIGRPEAVFGGLRERWEYFQSYVGSERLAYAFLWDIALYTFFQPWLIGDNLENVKIESRETLRILRFVPYVGLLAYIFGLQTQDGNQGD